jgi:hypothetical protein
VPKPAFSNPSSLNRGTDGLDGDDSKDNGWVERAERDRPEVDAP